MGAVVSIPWASLPIVNGVGVLEAVAVVVAVFIAYQVASIMFRVVSRVLQGLISFSTQLVEVITASIVEALGRFGAVLLLTVYDWLAWVISPVSHVFGLWAAKVERKPSLEDQGTKADPLIEALAVLGLEADCTREIASEAYRKISMAVNAHRTGSQWLEVRVNTAKDDLFKARGWRK